MPESLARPVGGAYHAGTFALGDSAVDPTSVEHLMTTERKLEQDTQGARALGTPDAEHIPTCGVVVGIGASAGGLDALRRLFGALPNDTGAAFVVIQHLAAERPSLLASVLAAATSLPVIEARNGMSAEPNHVYVIPPEFDLGIERGVLTLRGRELTGRLHLPIDAFFRSLAADAGERAIGVVLSGAGSDGTDGLRAIRTVGGFALAQAPDTAEFPSMPESALAADVVDLSGAPEALAETLGRWARDPAVDGHHAGRTPLDGEAFERVLAVLRQDAGRDFSGYKLTTLGRRIQRRMALARVGTLADYAGRVEADPAEAKALAEDMLIHVTSFFRDAAAFSALKADVFDTLLRTKGDGDTIRVWVPGCSTGEEAYSLAIVWYEALRHSKKQLSLKLFGSDLGAAAIDTARRGRYADSALEGVPPELVTRYFERIDGGYRVTRPIRESCIFVQHDLTRDPPFAHLDLVSCRNVLIYFEPRLQRRVVAMLHACLNPRGFLFLGQSEALTSYRHLFAPVDKGHRLFARVGEATTRALPMADERGSGFTVPLLPTNVERRNPLRAVQSEADHLLLARYAPPGVIVNARYDIVQYRGRTGSYLEPPPGLPQANVLRMAREGLVAHLHDALERAKESASSVRIEGILESLGDDPRLLDLEVVPLATTSAPDERFYLILFDDGLPRQLPRKPVMPEAPRDAPPDASTDETARIRAELLATKDYLQAILSEHQGTTDELAATNEDLVAANEELQSTNEELQSAKEELQSTNEELITLNDELRTRNHDLDVAASDLANVLASVELPVLIVDLDLRLRRFTPTARAIANFIPEDVGRPIEDIHLRLDDARLAERIREVVETLTPKDWEVRSTDGHWHRMQIRPYRTSDDRLDGAVVALVDIDVLKDARRDAERARDFARNIVDTVTNALVVVDTGLRVVSGNPAFFLAFGTSQDAIVGRPLVDAAPEFFAEPALLAVIRHALDTGRTFAGIEASGFLTGHGRRTLSVGGRAMPGPEGTLLLLAMEDVTDRRSLEAERAILLASEKEARLEAERANRAKDLFLATLSHELRTPLSTMLLSAQLLKKLAADDSRIERASGAIERAVVAQSKLIDDLLDVSRIVSGKLLLDLGPVELAALVQAAVEIARPAAAAKSIELELTSVPSLGPVYGDASRLQQVVGNLLTNAIKFTPHGGHVTVLLERRGDEACLTITDSGMGIRAEVLPQLFSRFVQADSSVTRTHGGLGLGLSIVRHLVDVHGGTVTAESEGEGRGATFRVTLPVGNGVPRAPATDNVSAFPVSGLRILLVEDDDDTRDALAAVMRAYGAEIATAATAAEGFAKLTSFRPAVLVSDIAMPGEDGYDLLRRVRRLPSEQGGQTPALALTALASDEERKAALEAGFDVHVAKPVDGARLAALVGELARRPRTAGTEPHEPRH